MKTLLLLLLLAAPFAAQAGGRGKIIVTCKDASPGVFNRITHDWTNRKHRIAFYDIDPGNGRWMYTPKVNGNTRDFRAIDAEVKALVQGAPAGTSGTFDYPGNVTVRFRVLKTGYTYTIKDR